MGRKKAGFYLLLIVFTGASGFVLGELLLRVMGPFNCSLSQTFPALYNVSHSNNHQLVRSQTVDHCDYLKDFKVTYEINKSGDRALPASIQPQYQAPKVLLVGDSYTFGHGLKDSETFGSHLQVLANKNKRFHVINRGVPGYTIDQQWNVLKQTLQKPQNYCSVVLQVHGSTDFLDLFSHGETAGTGKIQDHRYKVDNTHRLNSHAANVNVAKQFLRHLHLYRLFAEEIRGRIKKLEFAKGTPVLTKVMPDSKPKPSLNENRNQKIAAVQKSAAVAPVKTSPPSARKTLSKTQPSTKPVPPPTKAAKAISKNSTTARKTATPPTKSDPEPKKKRLLYPTFHWVEDRMDIVDHYNQIAKNFADTTRQHNLPLIVLVVGGLDKKDDQALMTSFRNRSDVTILYDKDFLTEEDYFPADHHFNPQGAKKVAEKLWETLSHQCHSRLSSL